MKISVFLTSVIIGLGIFTPVIKNNNGQLDVKNENVISLNEVPVLNLMSDDSSSESTDDSLATGLSVNLVSYNKANAADSLEFRIGINSDYPNANYYIGSYDSTNYYPAKIQYSYSNGSKTFTGETEIVKMANNGIGNSLGSTSLTTYCDIELPFDCTLDTDTLKLTNCFEVEIVKNEEGVTVGRNVDYTSPKSATLGKASTFKENDLSNFIDARFVDFTKYKNFTAVKLHFDNKSAEKYTSISSTYKNLYSQNEKEISAGTIYIRTRIQFGGDTKFLVTETSGEEHSYSSIATSVNITNGGDFIFLVENLEPSQVSEFKFFSASLSVELFNTSTSKIVARSQYSMRYGYFEFRMADILNSDGTVGLAKVADPKTTNLDIILLIILAVFILLFAAGDVAYFFYLKKKDEKSEFKVLKPAEFIKMTILSFITLFAIIFDVIYITIRCTVFNNAIAVYNPTDWIIIVLSVIVICFGGYFIKYFYTAIKNKKEKARRDKLNLNQDSYDDGIGVIKVNK